MIPPKQVPYRAVIQAGGNVTANFTSNISNTNTTANAAALATLSPRRR
jgi:filamentous hemagglutinin